MFGLPIGWIVAGVDIALIVHAARTGRFMPWGFVILFLPGIGALAYVVVELVPEWLGSTGARRAGRSVVAALDPERRYRDAKDELAIVDTIANRAALAEACLSLGKFEEARDPLRRHPRLAAGRRAGLHARPRARRIRPRRDGAGGRDARRTEGALARLPLAGRPSSLRQGAGRRGPRSKRRSRAYEAVGAYYPGAEPRVRRAELLARLGRADEARALADEVARGLRRAPAHVRRAQSQWLAAAEKLARR